MIRATIWTVGLFGAGAAISGTFTAGWTQPLVLLVLGVVFLFVSRSTANTAATPAHAAAPRGAPDLLAKLPARPVAAKPAAAPAAVPVEQSA